MKTTELKKKTILWIVGIIVLLTIIGFAMASCDDDKRDDELPGEVIIGYNDVYDWLEGYFVPSNQKEGINIRSYLWRIGTKEIKRESKESDPNNFPISRLKIEQSGSYTLTFYDDTEKSKTSAPFIVPFWAKEKRVSFLVNFIKIRSISCLAYGNGKWFIGTGNGVVEGVPQRNSPLIYWKPEMEYHFSNSPGSYDSVSVIAYGNGKWVAGVHHRAGNNPLDSSFSILETWEDDYTTMKLVRISNIFDGGIYAIAYGDGKFIAAGGNGKMATSTDGTTWTAVADSGIWDYTYNGNTNKASISEIAYGNGKWVAGCYVQAIHNSKMATSTDGTTWTAVDVSSIFDSIIALAYGGGKFIAAGGNGKMATSTDGTTWTAVADSGIWDYTYNGNTYKASISEIAYGNGKFIAAGGNGKMATSTDGTTWTAVDVIFDTDIGAFAYGDNTWVVVPKVPFYNKYYMYMYEY
ncbi:hypothetical protein R84B8_03013 [Treponema sp. R8-4-B8]